jgi:hypothetical protein
MEKKEIDYLMNLGDSLEEAMFSLQPILKRRCFPHQAALSYFPGVGYLFCCKVKAADKDHHNPNTKLVEC